MPFGRTARASPSRCTGCWLPFTAKNTTTARTRATTTLPPMIQGVRPALGCGREYRGLRWAGDGVDSSGVSLSSASALPRSAVTVNRWEQAGHRTARPAAAAGTVRRLEQEGQWMALFIVRTCQRRSGGRKAAPAGPAKSHTKRTLAAAPFGAWLVRFRKNTTGMNPCLAGLLEAKTILTQAEHLPSLDFEQPINRTRTINLQGLRTSEEAKTLAARYLKEKRPVRAKESCGPLHPFPEEVINVVLDATKGNPRKFLETLGQILEHAVANGKRNIDLSLVEPLLGNDYQDATDEESEGGDEFENEER